MSNFRSFCFAQISQIAQKFNMRHLLYALSPSIINIVIIIKLIYHRQKHCKNIKHKIASLHSDITVRFFNISDPHYFWI